METPKIKNQKRILDYLSPRIYELPIESSEILCSSATQESFIVDSEQDVLF